MNHRRLPEAKANDWGMADALQRKRRDRLGLDTQLAYAVNDVDSLLDGGSSRPMVNRRFHLGTLFPCVVYEWSILRNDPGDKLMR